ncbi:ABC transporter ATP-binding protein [Nanchangia anserum]|uniref:ABC transporter ATP-binding protein n=1 Tax=Nanchangia anserum TaxID=2692125 RepID=A0A8I0KVP4_9ACTO|nr:ABC transporter ATP-binding protein [Nanchangia anserum]MBD3689154.1 ABC transporter ATP-binding protein [Nanchangia anserum]QOX81386.1 ABC transporter ATP-binding protein [Nanchangia anserum]
MAIRVSGAQKRYGDHVALDIAELEIPSGRVVGLLGENGAGKSTLIDLIAGVSSPTRGHIETASSKIGWCSQRLVIDWFVSGWMNVWLGACLAGLSGSQAKEATDRAITQAGLDDAKLDSTPEVLSGGQQQRLMIARTFAMNPDIYLLDEPTVGLDIGNLERFTQRVREVRADGATVIVSSHEFEAVEDLIDDVIFLAGGRVTFFGSRRDFTDTFVTREVIRVVVDRPVDREELGEIPGCSMEVDGTAVVIDAPRGTDFAAVLSCLPADADVREYARQPVGLRQAVKWASQ